MHDAAYWLVLLAGCVAMGVMSWLTPYKEDDKAFTLIEGVWTPITTLGDLVQAWVNHYQDANGRTANMVAMTFCAFANKHLFDIINALVFGIMAHLVSLHSTGRRSLLALTMFLTYVGCAFPITGETMLWLTGSCNYMWAVTLALALLWALRQWHGRLNWQQGITLAVLAWLTGSFNEATSMGLWGGLLLYCLCNKRQRTPAAAISLTACLLGIALVVASPGAWDRAAGGDLVANLPAGQLIMSRLHVFVEKMQRFITPFTALAVGVACLFTRRGRHALVSNVWAPVTLALAAVMFALGINGERAYAALATAAFIVTAMGADWLLRRWQLGRAAVVAAGLVLATWSLARAMRVVVQYKAWEDPIVAQIWQAPAQCVLTEQTFDGYSRFVSPVCYRSMGYFTHEQMMCGYYGKANIQFAPADIAQRYADGTLLAGAVTLPCDVQPTGLVDSVMLLTGDKWMAVVLNDSVPAVHTIQQTQYYFDGNVALALDADELERRKRYNLVMDYTPRSFFPLGYQGHKLLIFPVITSEFHHITFPLSLSPTPVATITPVKQQQATR